MRKVLVVLMGLILSAFMLSCSEDSTKTTQPAPPDFEISTATIPTGYTCTPYNVELEAVGGTSPYAWALAAGSDPLPAGMSLSAEGVITGVFASTGEHIFTVTCTDNSETPETLEQEYILNFDVPANPSLAIFFDDQAGGCCSTTEAWNVLDCYVFIMLEGSEENCATATEFKLRLTDINDVDLEAGTDYTIYGNVTYPAHVSLTMGDLFGGLAISFGNPIYSTSPIHVATFGLLLLEDINQLGFKFEAYPEGSLAIASCEDGYPIVEVSGREAAINY